MQRCLFAVVFQLVAKETETYPRVTLISLPVVVQGQDFGSTPDFLGVLEEPHARRTRVWFYVCPVVLVFDVQFDVLAWQNAQTRGLPQSPCLRMSPPPPLSHILEL